MKELKEFNRKSDFEKRIEIRNQESGIRDQGSVERHLKSEDCEQAKKKIAFGIDFVPRTK